MIESWTALRYRGPHGPDGHIELTLLRDHRARLTAFVTNVTTPVIEGVLANWVLPELFTALDAAGFPNLARDNAGRVALLSVASDAGMIQVWLPAAERGSPAVARAVLLLEAIARSLSGGTLSSFSAVERPVLRDSHAGRVPRDRAAGGEQAGRGADK